MSLTVDKVQNIAHLARLVIQPEEMTGLQHDLSNVLDLVEHMNSVDTTDVQPMAHPLAMRQRLRPDQVAEQNRREAYQQIAPDTEKGLYLVPRVIE